MNNQKYWEQVVSLNNNGEVGLIIYKLQLSLYSLVEYEMYSSIDIEFIIDVNDNKRYLTVTGVRMNVGTLKEADAFIREYLYPTLSDRCLENERVTTYFNLEWDEISKKHITYCEHEIEAKLLELGV